MSRLDQAMLLFGRGYKTAYIAQRLGISYAEAQHYRIIFLKSEEIPEKVQESITGFYKNQIDRETQSLSSSFELIKSFVLFHHPEASRGKIFFPGKKHWWAYWQIEA